MPRGQTHRALGQASVMEADKTNQDQVLLSLIAVRR